MKKLKTWPESHTLVKGTIKLKLQILRPIPSILVFFECYSAGVPSPRAVDWCWPVAHWELGCTAGGEWQMNEWSFICIFNHSRCSRFHLSSVFCQISFGIRFSQECELYCAQIIPRPSPDPGLWKNCLPWNQSLVPKRLGTPCCRAEWRSGEVRKRQIWKKQCSSWWCAGKCLRAGWEKMRALVCSVCWFP